jgi:hypothetical protein
MLPESVQNLVRLIGFGLTMKMVNEMGGERLHIPRRPEGGEYDWLVDVLGEGAAEVVQKQYRGENLYIPFCARALIADRDRLVIARYEAFLKAGYSGRAASRLIRRDPQFRGISYRTIQKIVNRPAPPGMPEMVVQGTLF